MSDINQWREIAQKNPIIFLEQAWIDLQDDSSREARDVYKDVATLDPTNTARLVQNYAKKPWAAEVLLQAYRAFPTALETYPQWKELPFAAEVQEGIESAMTGRGTAKWTAKAMHGDKLVEAQAAATR